MDLLVLGGTVFLGRHVVHAALERGDRVTIFHRGRHPLDAAFRGAPRLEVIHGDRRRDLGLLGGRRWDAVIDTSGFVPSEVASAATALGSRVGRYQFVSSISAFASFAEPNLTEDTPLATLSEAERIEGESLDREDPQQTPRFHALYGALKAACERELERLLGDRAQIVRPGLIVGPHDPTDRFTYWVERGARGGEALAPGSPARPVQLVDARDLGEWMIRLADSADVGAMNATGPDRVLTMGELLDACITIGDPDTRLEWCDEGFLLDQGVGPWMELPLWLPERDASTIGLMRVDCRRAFESGLTFRPLAATVRDTLAWTAARPEGTPRRAGLDPARERQLLERWHEQQAPAARSLQGE
jgi:2'-hydroxyisoflavone reductase